MHSDAMKGYKKEDWIRLLSISTRLSFPQLRARAISELESLSFTDFGPIDRICLAQQHDIPTWSKPSYVELCKREEPLATWEAEKIGMQTAFFLAKARERERVRASELGVRGGAKIYLSEIIKIIEEIFEVRMYRL